MLVPISSVQEAGVAIRTMRKRAGIRIDDFALIAGVSKQFMTDLENGKPTVQMGKVLGLLKRMAVSVSLDLSDDAVDRYKAELEKATRRRTQKEPPNGQGTAGGEVRGRAGVGAIPGIPGITDRLRPGGLGAAAAGPARLGTGRGESALHREETAAGETQRRAGGRESPPLGGQNEDAGLRGARAYKEPRHRDHQPAG